MLLSMAKTSGRCPPSLIGEGRIIEGSEFESKLLSALDGASSQGEYLRVVAIVPLFIRGASFSLMLCYCGIWSEGRRLL